MKYVVIQLQTNTNGTLGNLVWSFDDLFSAESKYHTVLASAAISTLPKHACALMKNDGSLLARQCYNHEESTIEDDDNIIQGE